jgi:SAM-dependent methyltransferase
LNTQDPKKLYQFYETPDEVADRLVEYIPVRKSHNPFVPNLPRTILEPSAGRGAIVRAINRRYSWAKVYAVEIWKENIDNFNGECARLTHADFMTHPIAGQVDCIVANPPFRRNQDIDHFRKMWELCAPGGRIICIMSNHWRFCMNNKELRFRVWIEKLKPEIVNLPEGWAKKSGTMNSACIVVVDKPEE